MNTTMTMDNGPHDADLVRYLDGESTASERAALEAAMGADPDLDRSLNELREASDHFGALLAESDVPMAPAPPDFTRVSPRRQQRLLAAAVVILTGTGLLAVPPVRASLVQGLRSVAGWITGAAESDASDVPAPNAPSGDATVSAAFTGSTFAVLLDQDSPTGALEVARSPEDRVSATASPGTELLFLTGRLVVRTPAGGEVRVTVTVPEGVTSVEVSTSSGAVRHVHLTESVPRVRVILDELRR